MGMGLPLIAIVDDDDMMRAATEGLVRSLGFDTLSFPSAETFLKSAAPFEAACLILDVQLPNMSGIELQRHLRRSASSLPIIFITAFPDETAGERALNDGAVCYLSKHELFDFERRLLQSALNWPAGNAPIT
jgi:FixJ family two-component response regulator